MATGLVASALSHAGTPLQDFQARCRAVGVILCNGFDSPADIAGTYGYGFPISYNSCTASASHGAYDPFYQPFGAYDFKLQNARSARDEPAATI